MNLTITEGCLWCRDLVLSLRAWINFTPTKHTNNKQWCQKQTRPWRFCWQEVILSGDPSQSSCFPDPSFFGTIHRGCYCSLRFSKLLRDWCCTVYSFISSCRVWFGLGGHRTQTTSPSPGLVQSQQEGWVPCACWEIPAPCKPVWTSSFDRCGFYTLETCTMENTMKIAGVSDCQIQGSRGRVKEVPLLLEASWRITEYSELRGTH